MKDHLFRKGNGPSASVKLAFVQPEDSRTARSFLRRVIAGRRDVTGMAAAAASTLSPLPRALMNKMVAIEGRAAREGS
jgi:hypothetical protein